jgi:hypothetical protein
MKISRSIGVKFAVTIPEEMNKFIYEWEDGGTNEKVKGWSGTGWGYGVTDGKSTVYALAVEKNAPDLIEDEDGYESMPENYEYNEQNIVFLIRENESRNQYTAFSKNKQIINDFCKDFNIELTKILEDTSVNQLI